jgi:hypothetical protein
MMQGGGGGGRLAAWHLHEDLLQFLSGVVSYSVTPIHLLCTRSTRDDYGGAVRRVSMEV